MDTARRAAVCTPSPPWTTPPTPTTSPPPRPLPVVAAALATCGLGMTEARQAEWMLAFVREPTVPRPGTFRMAVEHALWAVAQDHRRAFVALHVGRLVLAALLFVAGTRACWSA